MILHDYYFMQVTEWIDPLQLVMSENCFAKPLSWRCRHKVLQCMPSVCAIFCRKRQQVGEMAFVSHSQSNLSDGCPQP